MYQCFNSVYVFLTCYISATSPVLNPELHGLRIVILSVVSMESDHELAPASIKLHCLHAEGPHAVAIINSD